MKRFGLTEWLEKNPRAKKRYIQDLPAYIDRLSKSAPIIKDLRDHLLPLISLKIALDPKQFRKLINALIKFGPSLAGETLQDLICGEIRQNGTTNFKPSVFFNWLDQLMERRCYYTILKCVQQFDQKGIKIPEKRVVSWGWRAIRAFEFRTGGEIIFSGGCARSTLLKTEDIHSYALNAAETNGDHGITRLFGLLLIRLAPKKRGRLSFKKAQVLAEVVNRVFTERKGSDRDFTPGFLIKMAANRLPEKGFSMMLSEYLRMAEESEKDRAEKFQKALHPVREYFELRRLEQYMRKHGKKHAPSP